MNEEQIKAELIAKNPELAKNPAALQAAVQNAMKGQTPNSFGGGTFVDEVMAGRANEAENKIAELEQQKRMTNPIEGASGNIAKGNQGDNAIANPNAADTSQVTQAHKEELASVQTPDNPNPATFTTNPKDVEARKAESKANAEAQPSKNDTPVEKKAKNKYRNQSMSIWDAYYNGEFGDPNSDEAKSTRNYFIVDAIANFAKNTGRSIGNIGAQYSGGTIDNGHDTSKWEEIRNTLGGEELSIAKEQLGGPAERRATSEMLSNKLTALSANRSATVNDLIEEVKKEAENATSETVKKSYLALAAMLSGANMNGVSLGATAATGLIEDITNALKGE